ncbi:uncharacterized protein CMU_041550 [Cryptosporidium muris RN66]|uniref:Uncharacterized protein n=1 Tax=Cryptosporidium muris (strain RN66) TaxID=441375 RepID=B6AA42_CRYMR|nr:uncharacterized protein CMU_041550 [Cryptosporidium muris RN66]EEA05083.1 hypothetical protein CMU_041550 [Cryptosporidium muris RN66]|eukprot:XP_002139432.1 hypothetical protein [Cryptosporidium muris RN66]
MIRSRRCRSTNLTDIRPNLKKSRVSRENFDYRHLPLQRLKQRLLNLDDKSTDTRKIAIELIEADLNLIKELFGGHVTMSINYFQVLKEDKVCMRSENKVGSQQILQKIELIGNQLSRDTSTSDFQVSYGQNQDFERRSESNEILLNSQVQSQVETKALESSLYQYQNKEYSNQIKGNGDQQLHSESIQSLVRCEDYKYEANHYPNNRSLTSKYTEQSTTQQEHRIPNQKDMGVLQNKVYGQYQIKEIRYRNIGKMTDNMNSTQIDIPIQQNTEVQNCTEDKKKKVHKSELAVDPFQPQIRPSKSHKQTRSYYSNFDSNSNYYLIPKFPNVTGNVPTYIHSQDSPLLQNFIPIQTNMTPAFAQGVILNNQGPDINQEIPVNIHPNINRSGYRINPSSNMGFPLDSLNYETTGSLTSNKLWHNTYTQNISRSCTLPSSSYSTVFPVQNYVLNPQNVHHEGLDTSETFNSTNLMGRNKISSTVPLLNVTSEYTLNKVPNANVPTWNNFRHP